MSRKHKGGRASPPLPDGSQEGRTIGETLAALVRGEIFKPRKYRNQPVEVDGVRFDSKKEARRWSELVLLEKQGVIRNLRRGRQVKYPLIVNGVLVATYIPDAVYEDVETGRVCVEDTKGCRTREYLLKKRLFFALKGIKVLET